MKTVRDDTDHAKANEAASEVHATVLPEESLEIKNIYARRFEQRRATH